MHRLPGFIHQGNLDRVQGIVDDVVNRSQGNHLCVALHPDLRQQTIREFVSPRSEGERVFSLSVNRNTPQLFPGLSYELQTNAVVSAGRNMLRRSISKMNIIIWPKYLADRLPIIEPPVDGLAIGYLLRRGIFELTASVQVRPDENRGSCAVIDTIRRVTTAGFAEHVVAFLSQQLHSREGYLNESRRDVDIQAFASRKVDSQRLG